MRWIEIQCETSPVVKVGELNNVPPLPRHYLERTEVYQQLKSCMLSDALTTIQGICGMGGVGKSVLAIALARDTEIGKAFPDGIIWLSFGNEINDPGVIARQCQLTDVVSNERPEFYDTEQGRAHLQKLFAHKACLVILDNVWHFEHAEAFTGFGPSCRLLITTRDESILRELNAEHLKIEPLLPKDALRLLAWWSGQTVESLSTKKEVASIAQKCGYLPLALSVIGAMIQRRPKNWHNILERLYKASLKDIPVKGVGYPRQENLLGPIQVSVEALDKQMQACYHDLAVFPKENAIPEATLLLLWKTWDMDCAKTQEYIDLLEDLSLLSKDERGWIRLHDLQVDYIREQVGKGMAGLHNRLVQVYKSQCSDGLSSGPNDGYFLEHIVLHLIGCSCWDSLSELLTDLRFLERRCATGQVPNLIRDFQQALADFPRSDVEEEPHRKQRSQEVKAYASAMMSYASSWTVRNGIRQQPIPEPIATTGPLNKLPFGGTPAVASDEADGLARLHAYYSFIAARSHALARFGILEGYPLQEAYAFSCDSIVSRDAEGFLNGLTDKPLLLPTSSSRPCYYTRPALVRTMATDEYMLEATSLSWDGKRAISGGHANIIRIWDLDTGECLKEFGGHDGYIHHTYIAPDGMRACSSDFWGRSLRVWDLKNWECERVIDLRLGCNQMGCAEGMAATPDLGRAITGGWGYTLALWDLRTGRCLRILQEHNKALEAVCITADGRKAVWGSWDTLRIWDLETGECSALPTEHEELITAVAMTPDGKTVVTGSQDKTIRVWDLDACCCLQTFRDHVDPVKCLSITPDGKLLVSGGGSQGKCKDPALRIWDLEEGRCIARLEGHTDTVQSVDLTPDGTTAVSCGSDSTIRLWDLQGEPTRAISPHKDAVTAIVDGPGGKTALSAGRDGSILAWDYHTGEGSEPFKGDTVPWLCLAVHPGGNMAISGGNGDALYRWDIPGRKQFDTLVQRDKPRSTHAL